MFAWKRLTATFALTLVGVVSLGVSAFAANPKPTIRDEAYMASFVSQSIADPVTIEAGQTKTITIKWKNTGTATWNASGKAFISAYAMEPRDRSSVFAGKNWISKKQTGAIKAVTKPGATAELVIDFTAPDKPGTYTEEFHLAAENYSWVKGGYFFLKIVVTPKTTVVAPKETIPTPAPEAITPTAYKANRFILNQTAVKAAGGERVEVIVGFQNVGTTPWKTYSFVSGGSTALAAVGNILAFADTTWVSKTLALQRSNTVAPGGFLRETIQFRTPPKTGTYTARFDLHVEGVAVSDGWFEIPIEVTTDAPSGYEPPFWENETAPPPEPVRAVMLPEEPRIRVGIWRDPGAFVQFRSNDDDYTVFDGTTEVGILPVGKMGVLKVQDGKYMFSGGDIEIASNQYIRLVPRTNPHAIFRLPNFNHFVKWKGPNNFNMYRGAMEYRSTEDGKNIYVINDVLLEDYVAGIGEASNGAPIEYIKALSVAARSYAYYIQQYTDKHDKRNFDVVAHTGDQLYLGYECERISPNVVVGTKATRGYVVTYEGNVVVTPYFGHSDGRTRAWTEKWGGTTKPWLVSVKATYDKGQRMFGHGVGMSQRDAAYRAEKDGASWQDLVNHYYTGITLQRLFE